MKAIYFILLSLFVFSAKAQEINYFSIKKVITETFPDIDFNNKLLAVCVWNSQNALSREQNKEFNRTYNVYKGARLKGGLKGVVFVSVSSDDNKTNFDIAIQKDGLTYDYTLCDFKGYELNSKLNNMILNTSLNNMVFDTYGALILNNLSTETIYTSFNNLITR